MARLIAGFILSVPGILLGVLAFLAFGDEYFFLPYLLFSLVLAAGAFIGGVFLTPQPLEKRFWPIFLRLALAACLAVLFALVVLAAINLTPLCVGQNNGDGTNDLGLCVVQTALVAVFFGPLVLGLLGLAVMVASLILHRFDRRGALASPVPRN